MTPIDGLLERLLNANEKQADGTGALVEIQRQNAEQLTNIREQGVVQNQILSRLAERLDHEGGAREAAVVAIQKHTEVAIKLAFGASELWWRRAFMIGVTLMVIAELLGVPVRWWVDVMARAHP